MEQLLGRGGPVMYVLLAVSIAAVAIIIERALFFLFLRDDYKKLVDRIEENLDAGQPDKAVEVAEAKSGPISRVLAVCIHNWGEKSEHLREIVDYEAGQAIAELEKRLRALAVIARTSPLLGLLGTVAGMIRTFVAIESGGNIQVASLAGGIWEALSTTAFGLAIAIPTLVVFNYFEAKVDSYIQTINYCIQRLIRFHEAGHD